MEELKQPYTRISNEIIEALYSSDLSALDIKVFFYIVRHTYGIQGRKLAHIKIKDISENTGYSYCECSRIFTKLRDRKMVIAHLNGRGCIKEMGVNKNTKEWVRVLCKTTNNVVQNHNICCPKPQPLLVKESIKESIKERTEPSAAKAVFSKVYSLGFNIYKLINRIKKQSVIIRREGINDEVLIAICNSWLKNKSKIDNEWGWFLKAFREEMQKWRAKQHENESNQRKEEARSDYTPKTMKEIMEKALRSK